MHCLDLMSTLGFNFRSKDFLTGLEIYIFCPLDAHIIRGVLTIYSQVRKALRSTGLSDTYKVRSFFLLPGTLSKVLTGALLGICEN